jgi:hypothetical protein
MDPDNKVLPKFDELPLFHDFKGCAWGLWGPDDQLGTVNLLTEKVVARAAQEEIKYVFTVCSIGYTFKIYQCLRLGKTVSLNW